MIHAIGRAIFLHNLLVYFWVGVGEVHQNHEVLVQHWVCSL